jgi:hypothetical protein
VSISGAFSQNSAPSLQFMFPTGQRDLSRLRTPRPPPGPREHLGDPSSSSIKKKFTEQEDSHLIYLVGLHGTRDWKTIAWHMNGRTVRQCRERFKYYLAPGIDRPAWTDDEDRLLMARYGTIGPKWAQLAVFFDGRTDIDLKNRYHRLRRLMKRSKKQGSGNLVDCEKQDVSGLHAGSDLRSPRPRLPSLTPGVDFVSMSPIQPVMAPIRPRRIICSNENVKRESDQRN